MCVCVYVCNGFLFILIIYYIYPILLTESTLGFTTTPYFPPFFTPTARLPRLYANISSARLFVTVLCFFRHANCPSSARLSSLWIPILWVPYPLHSASSTITASSTRSGLWPMYSSLSLFPQRRRVLDLTITINILAPMKPHISEYFCF